MQTIDSLALQRFRRNMRLSLNGETLTEFAQRIGAARPFLSRVMNGKAAPTIPMAERIASGLGKKLGQMLVEEKAKKSSRRS